MNSQDHFRSGERVGGNKWRRRDQVFVGWERHKPRPLREPLGDGDVGVEVSLEADEESSGRKEELMPRP